MPGTKKGSELGIVTTSTTITPTIFCKKNWLTQWPVWSLPRQTFLDVFLHFPAAESSYLLEVSGSSLLAKLSCCLSFFSDWTSSLFAFRTYCRGRELVVNPPQGHQGGTTGCKDPRNVSQWQSWVKGPGLLTCSPEVMVAHLKGTGPGQDPLIRDSCWTAPCLVGRCSEPAQPPHPVTRGQARQVHPWCPRLPGALHPLKAPAASHRGSHAPWEKRSSPRWVQGDLSEDE